MIHTLSLRTRQRTELVDITGEVEALVCQSGVTEGVCHIFQAHTTAGLTINENADPSVAADILMVLNRITATRRFIATWKATPRPTSRLPSWGRSSPCW